MGRHLKKRMIVLTVMALMLAQILPAFALTISFTTEANPAFHIVSSTITLNQTGVNGSQSGELWRMTFSKPLGAGFILYVYGHGGEGVIYNSTGGDSASISSSGGVGYNYVALNVQPSQQLSPGTVYDISIYRVRDADGTLLDPTDPSNAPYFTGADAFGDKYFGVTFTTAFTPGWTSTTVNDADSGNVTGGQTNVPIVNAVIKVKSNNALQSGTVNTTNIVLHEGSEGGTTIAAAVSLDTDNQTIIVSPGTLKYSTTYFLVLTGVTDTTNTSL